MHIAQPLLLLLAFSLTHAAFAGDRTLTHREKAFKKAFEDLAAKEAARCLQPDQGNREICSRPAIQMRMEQEKKKREEFAAQVDPRARMLNELRKKESSAERAAGRASVGSSPVVLHNRIDVPRSSPQQSHAPRPSQPQSRPSQPVRSGQRPSQGPRSRM